MDNTFKNEKEEQIPTLVRIDDAHVMYKGKSYNADIDHRGCRSKFWFDDDKYMFKGRYKHNVWEPQVEVLIYNILKEVDVDCAKYKMASLEDGNKQQSGVVTQNYKTGRPNDIEEISGKSLLMYSRNFTYDNSKGNEITFEHTVDDYVAMAEMFFPETDLHALRQGLLKIVLVDYLVLQTDRHFQNISFFKQDNQLELVPMYDNSNAFCLLHGDKCNIFLDNYMKANRNAKKNTMIDRSKVVPMLGIKTVTSKLLTTNLRTGDLYNSLHARNEELLQTFEKELADELLKDRELRRLFEALGNINLRELIERVNIEEHTEIDERATQWIVSIFDYKRQTLLETMNKEVVTLDRGIEI